MCLHPKDKTVSDLNVVINNYLLLIQHNYLKVQFFFIRIEG